MHNAVRQWWDRQTRKLKVLLSVGTLLLVFGLWLQNAGWAWNVTWFFDDGSTGKLDITQAVNACNALNGNYPNALTASDCQSAHDWHNLLGLAAWVGIALLVWAAIDLYRHRRRVS